MAALAGYGGLKTWELTDRPPGLNFRAVEVLRKCMWQSISNAPFGRDLEVAVVDRGDTHALVFPCRRILTGWINAVTLERVEVSPTHWREWSEHDSNIEADSQGQHISR